MVLKRFTIFVKKQRLFPKIPSMKASITSNAFVRFILSAGLLYLVLYLIYQFIVKRYTYYDQKFVGGIIETVESILHLIGYKTFKVLQDHDMQVIGIDGSNGV